MSLDPLATTDDLAARNITWDADTETTLVTTFLAEASAAVREAAGCPISQATSTINVVGELDDQLRLPGQPVQSVSTVEIDGSAVIKNSNGDIRLGQVGGDLRVRAANGDIAVEHSHGSINAKTANGRIRVGSIHGGSLVADTANGHIEVGIADGVAAWLDLDTRYGNVHNGLEAAEGPGSADQQVEVRARTGFGDITIRRQAKTGDELLSGATDHE